MSVVNAIPLLLGDEGYNISRSVRIRSSASANFTRTPAGTGNRRTWTWSSWVKRGRLGVDQDLFGYYTSGLNESIRFGSNDTLYRYCVDTSGTVNRVLLNTNAVYRDASAWYHIMVVQDTTQATDTNRVKIYVNGVQQSVTATVWPALNWDGYFNTVVSHQLFGSSGLYFDGLQTEMNFIDGQALTPSSFGETDAITGVWKPKKYAGTYGTNGFYLNFSDNSSNTATTIGKDYSGNGNNWTPNNISVTAGVTYDSMIDVPTLYADGGNGRGNYAVMNPLTPVKATLSNANLTVSGGDRYSISTIGITSGKWYAEMTVTTVGSESSCGIASQPDVLGNYVGNNANSWGYYSNGNKYTNATGTAYGSSYTSGDVIGIAFDADAGTLTFYKNNVSQGTAYTGLTSGPYYFAMSGRTGGTPNNCSINFGQRPFAYTPPTGFKALNTQNLPAPTILKGGSYFNPVLWTGNSTNNRSITGVGFQPDLTWIKGRSAAWDNFLFDSVRGANNYLISNSTGAAGSSSAGDEILAAFETDGFRVSANGNSNQSANTYVAWNWKESVSAGFDVVTYTGTGGVQTVNHSLGIAPKMILVKSRSDGSGIAHWTVYHASMDSVTPQSYAMHLNLTNARNASSIYWNSTAPTSTNFTLGGGSAGLNINNSGSTFVAYCFSEVAGFSRFGSYTGNGSADGPFVFCGFRPRFVMIKNSSAASQWRLVDTARSPYNLSVNSLRANDSIAENTSGFDIDLTASGFKIRGTGTDINDSGNVYIFAAFAESPFRTSLAR